MGKTTLTWEYDDLVGEGFKIYRADSPMDPENLPLPIATVGIEDREYIDETVIDNETYYYRISSYLGDAERLSVEIEHIAEDAGDPHWDNVVALLHFDGTDGSVVAIEEKGILMSVTRGTPSLSSAEFKFGGTSWHTSGGRITSPPLSNLAFGVGDFTVEAFVMPTNLGARAEQFIVCMRRNGQILSGQIMSLQNGRLGFSNGTMWRLGDTTLSENVWTHVAVSRESAVIRFFINGVLDEQGVDGTNFSEDRNLNIGNAEGSNNSPFYGFIDELRITKGVARYTENFTPPTAPFPNY